MDAILEMPVAPDFIEYLTWVRAQLDVDSVQFDLKLCRMTDPSHIILAIFGMSRIMTSYLGCIVVKSGLILDGSLFSHRSSVLSNLAFRLPK